MELNIYNTRIESMARLYMKHKLRHAGITIPKNTEFNTEKLLSLYDEVNP